MIEAMLDQFLDLCRYCDAEIVRAQGPGGETLRVNAKAPSGNEGNLALHVSGGKLHAAPLTRGQAAGMRAAGQVTYLDHALSCPRAKDWHEAATHGKATRRYASTSRGRRARR